MRLDTIRLMWQERDRLWLALRLGYRQAILEGKYRSALRRRDSDELRAIRVEQMVVSNALGLMTGQFGEDAS